MTEDELTKFEKRVVEKWKAGHIRAPIHLSGGNERQLIEIFKNIARDDWVLSTWRSHYHALLHGIAADELMRQIVVGKSMSISSVRPPFYSSSLVGGTLSVAVGLGMAIQRKRKLTKVWCFVGDMAAATGIFEEATKYAWNFRLPITFVVEDNKKSVQTPTEQAWGSSSFQLRKNAIYYQYNLLFPHHGSGVYVPF